MGWAKYFEDDMELAVERQTARQQRGTPSADPVIGGLILKNAETAIERRIPPYEDRHIPCNDCGKKFLFSATEQKCFAAKGWRKPKRCKKCRDYKNAQHLMCAPF